MTAVTRGRLAGQALRAHAGPSRGCTLSVPTGHVVGLVGPNGAGKSTLLNLAAGMLPRPRGRSRCSGHHRPADAAQLGRVGFVAQDTPTYAGLSVADHLRLGADLNPDLGRGAGANDASVPGPRPRPEGREALRRSTGAVGPHAGRRQAARAPAARRARGQPRSPGPTRVPPGPDGDRGRHRRERRALLTPGVRHRAGLRLPRRARRFRGPVSPATWTTCWRPTTASSDRGATRTGARRTSWSSRPATPTARARSSCGATVRCSNRPGRSSRSAWRTSCLAYMGQDRPRGAPRRRTTGCVTGCADRAYHGARAYHRGPDLRSGHDPARLAPVPGAGLVALVVLGAVAAVLAATGALPGPPLRHHVVPGRRARGDCASVTASR